MDLNDINDDNNKIDDIEHHLTDKEKILLNKHALDNTLEKKYFENRFALEKSITDLYLKGVTEIKEIANLEEEKIENKTTE